MVPSSPTVAMMVREIVPVKSKSGGASGFASPSTMVNSVFTSLLSILAVALIVIFRGPVME